MCCLNTFYFKSWCFDNSFITIYYHNNPLYKYIHLLIWTLGYIVQIKFLCHKVVCYQLYEQSQIISKHITLTQSYSDSPGKYLLKKTSSTSYIYLFIFEFKTFYFFFITCDVTFSTLKHPLSHSSGLFFIFLGQIWNYFDKKFDHLCSQSNFSGKIQFGCDNFHVSIPVATGATQSCVAMSEKK